MPQMMKCTRGWYAPAITAASLWLTPSATFAKGSTTHDLCREMAPDALRDCRAAADMLRRRPRSPEAGVTVRVTARADRLRYRYETTDPSTSQDCEVTHLALPASGRVRLLVTADDTIYAWRVPALGVSVDLIPGRINARLLDRAPARAASAPGTLRNETSGRETATEVRILDDGAPLDLRALCGG